MPNAHRDADEPLDETTATPDDTPELTGNLGAEPEVADVVAEVGDGGEEDAADSSSAVTTYDPLQRYLAEIRRYPLLSREEEHRIAVEYLQTGDLQAAYRLVTANLRLVVMIARQYQRAFRQLIDLIQEGNIGLMEAVKKYDPYRGIRFPSYAAWWIRAYVIRYLMNNWRLVKLGTTQAQRKLFFNLQKEKQRLEAEGIFPGPKLIAQRLDVKEHEVVEMEQRMASRDLSVDSPMNSDSDATMLDLLSSHEATTEDRLANAEYQQRLRIKIAEFGATLKGKDKVIFDARLMAEEPLTLQEIGEQYKISRERVRQLEARLKKKLKAHLQSEFEDLRDSTVEIG
jgi:RNA polymerase sigma-32 factor